MASRKQASERVRQWLSEHGVALVSEAVCVELGAAFPQLKPRSLRDAVRQCGLPTDPLVEGVRQNSFEELARTLVALQRAYEMHEPQRRRIRSMVIEAKARAKLVAARKPEKREMVEWMLVWLETPSLFETWVNLRLRSLADGGSGQMPGPDADEANADG